MITGQSNFNYKSIFFQIFLKFFFSLIQKVGAIKVSLETISNKFIIWKPQ